MTLKAEILLLLEKGCYRNKDIARIVGCKAEYVRTVKQRGKRGRSAADDRYLSALADGFIGQVKMKRYLGKRRDRYHSDAEFRVRHLAAVKRSYEKRKGAT